MNRFIKSGGQVDLREHNNKSDHNRNNTGMRTDFFNNIFPSVSGKTGDAG